MKPSLVVIGVGSVLALVAGETGALDPLLKSLELVKDMTPETMGMLTLMLVLVVLAREYVRFTKRQDMDRQVQPYQETIDALRAELKEATNLYQRETKRLRSARDFYRGQLAGLGEEVEPPSGMYNAGEFSQESTASVPVPHSLRQKKSPGE